MRRWPHAEGLGSPVKCPALTTASRTLGVLVRTLHTAAYILVALTDSFVLGFKSLSKVVLEYCLVFVVSVLVVQVREDGRGRQLRNRRQVSGEPQL